MSTSLYKRWGIERLGTRDLFGIKKADTKASGRLPVPEAFCLQSGSRDASILLLRHKRTLGDGTVSIHGVCEDFDLVLGAVEDFAVRNAKITHSARCGLSAGVGYLGNTHRINAQPHGGT